MTRWYVVFIHYIAYLGLCGDVSVVLYLYFFTEFLRAQHSMTQHIMIFSRFGLVQLFLTLTEMVPACVP